MAERAPYAISLVLHQDNNASGWRLHLHPDGAEGGHLISIKEAEEIARVATSILDIDDKTVTPFMIVRNGTTVLRESLQRELNAAEKQAANIPHLRRALGEMDGQ